MFNEQSICPYTWVMNHELCIMNNEPRTACFSVVARAGPVVVVELTVGPSSTRITVLEHSGQCAQ